MPLTLEEALRIAKDNEGYERCENPEHGFGKQIEVNGVRGKCKFMICPIVQFYPKPSFQFLSEEAFLSSCEDYYKRRGWI